MFPVLQVGFHTPYSTQTPFRPSCED